MLECPTAAVAQKKCPSHAQVIDANAAAYLHAYLHTFACSLNVNVCRALPSPVGGDFVFLLEEYWLHPLPRTPEPASLAHPGRRQAPALGGRGFPFTLT